MTFAPKGWKSIARLHHYFSSSITFWLDSDQLEELTWEGAEQRGLFAAWECLDSTDAAAVLSPPGTINLIETRVLASAGYIEQKSNEHLNLEYGTLGSGHGGVWTDAQDVDSVMDKHEAMLRYGPFAYLPILVPLASFKKFDEAFLKEVSKESGYDCRPSESKDLVQEIFSMIDSGRAKRRDDLKRLLANDMKHEEWRAHWREAVLLRPELGKPGPRGPRD